MNTTTRTTGVLRAAIVAALAAALLAAGTPAPARAAGRAVDPEVNKAHQEWEATVPEVGAAARAVDKAEAELAAARDKAAAAEAARDEAAARVEAAGAALEEVQSDLVRALAETELAVSQRDSAAAALEAAQVAARSRSGDFNAAGHAAGNTGLREEARIRTVHGRAQLDVVKAWHDESTASYERHRTRLTKVTEQRDAARHELESAERAHAEAVEAASAVAEAVDPATADVEEQREQLAARQARHDDALADLRGLGWRAGVLGRGGLVWPTDGPPGSRFGQRRHPISRRVRLHAGVDVPADTGQNVLATAAGTVTFAGANGGYGFVVDIDHGGGRVSRYAHLSYIHVRPGDRVEQAQRIGRVGSTGASTGPHLHFEYRVGGQPKDPLNWFASVVDD